MTAAEPSVDLPGLDISAFRGDDESQVIALWQACDLLRPWNNPALDIKRKLAFQPELFLVARLQQQLVGSAMFGYDGHRGSVNYLAVAPRHRRRSVAAALMQAGTQALLVLGCPKINLQMREGNHEVSAFYQHLGYEIENRLDMGKRLILD